MGGWGSRVLNLWKCENTRFLRNFCGRYFRYVTGKSRYFRYVSPKPLWWVGGVRCLGLFPKKSRFFLCLSLLRFDFYWWSRKCWVVDTFRKNNRSTTMTQGSKHWPWPLRSVDVTRNHSWLTNLRQKIERGKFASIDFVFLLKSTEVTWKRRRPDTSCLIFYWLWQSSPSISSSLQSPLSSSHLILTVSFQLKFLNY